MERPQNRRGSARLEEVTDQEHDAVEVAPWQAARGARPRITRWRRRPRLEVRVAGQWRLATVLARHDYPGGSSAYQVEITLGDTGAASIRTYTWDPRAMRPVGSLEQGTKKPPPP